jgi:hypothetical protein
MIRRPRNKPNRKVRDGAEMPVPPDAALLAAGPHDQAHNAAGDRTVSVGVHPDEEVR